MSRSRLILWVCGVVVVSSCAPRGPHAAHAPSAAQLVEVEPMFSRFLEAARPGVAHTGLLQEFSRRARTSGRIDAVCAEFLEGRDRIAPEHMARSAAKALPTCRFACLPDFDDLFASADPWTVVLRDCPDPKRPWVERLKSAKNKAWWVDYLLVRGAFGAIEAELEANEQGALWPRYREMLPALAASMVQWQTTHQL